MKKEEYILQLSMLEQQAREIQQQLGLVNQKIRDMDILKNSIEKIREAKENEFLAPLGEGLFIKSKIEDKELFINVGSKIVVRKSIKEIDVIIEKQVHQLEELRSKMEKETERLNLQLQSIVEQAQQDQQREETGDEPHQTHEHEDHVHEKETAKKTSKKKK